MKKTSLFFCFLIVFVSTSISQVVNAYAKVTAIAGTTLTLSNVNQTNHTFIVGEYVVIMQMQGDVIGANTNNDAAFGNLSSVSSTGLFEIKQITAIDGNSTAGFSSGAPTSLTVISITNTYSTVANASLQIISFRRMSATNFSTTSNITALDWNGNVGGVVAIDVPGTLTLNHSITANAAGFTGGTVSTNTNGTQCVAANTIRYRENSNTLGFKGEGIYKNTNALYNNGRAKILNGGGGGSHHNGGGGGGGNYSAGGLGGNGYNNCTTHPAGGLGGISLSSVIDGNRIFMGGGGGGGQQNNTQGRNGGDGGGIILIKANVITSGTCAVSISANGVAPATNGNNDGGGGGGAGGSIVFWVNTWNILATCPVTISANGGNGSTSLDGQAHAGGGAGGQGVLIFNGPTPVTNVTTTTNNGTAGCNNSTNPCTNSAGSASGVNGAGVFGNLTNPLPIELVSFKAELISINECRLTWKTASEINNDFFTVMKSYDGENWFELNKISGAGNSSVTNHYSLLDPNITSPITYYQLKQTDYDGTSVLSEIVSVYSEMTSNDILIYPNPTENEITIQSNSQIISISIVGLDGRILKTISGNSGSTISVELSDLPDASYFLQINSESGIVYRRIVKN
jgi:hypothetical protein